MRVRAGYLLWLMSAGLTAAADSLPLAGTWTFRLDPGKVGASEKWYARPLSTEDRIFLPGSTDEAGYGTKTSTPEKDRLSRPYVYEGAAWYQRLVTIPESWRGKRITLHLERPHWRTEVWVDGRAFGAQDSLSTPHVYDLTAALTPGQRLVTLAVDNSYHIDVGRRAHSVTDWTQTNWNGIVGRIELRAGDPIWIDSVRAFPDAGSGVVRLEAVVRNQTGKPAEGELRAGSATAKFTGAGAERLVALTVPLPGRIRLWDEYDPQLHTLEVSLSAAAGEVAARGRASVTFGVREIATRGTQFVLNGRPIFLRGTLECAIFPKTGYPPTDVESWARLFRIARSYGLNHFRFHSWCPPEAAFVAADRAGFLLHVELPVWSNRVGKDPALDEFMRAEGRRILNAYGNHPSFTMLCLGNELVGDDRFMDDLVAEFKKSDGRRLYTFSADHRRRSPGPTSDYYVTHNNTGGRLRLHGARFGQAASGTDADFSLPVRATPVPLVAHEIGQWAAYPSFDEIGKYTGVLKARNLEAFRDQLAERGMLDQARAFQHAGGRFAWLAYKEDLETAFRTPGLGGFQMLQLYDFPGQGEALVGLLDSFWESKGILSPEEFRGFCDQTVPLLRMRKFVWTADETLSAKALLAHYGRQPLAGAVGEWSVREDTGRERASGTLPPIPVPLGSVTALGDIRLPLAGFERAARLRITLGIQKTGLRNSWDIWVYPGQLPEPALPDEVLLTRSLDAAARAKLEAGGTVVLLRARGTASERTLPTQFLPVFWSLSFFPKQSGVMGILCDPLHPALSEFPTDPHSAWQWWELLESSRAFVLDETPPGFRPIVQVIDDYHRNHKLGAVFEARVGKGKLLACSLDLESELAARPVARQLRYSLWRYAGSRAFAPKDELPLTLLLKLLD